MSEPEHRTDAAFPPVYCVLHNGIVSFVSSTSPEVSGFPPEHFHGRRAIDLIHADDRGRVAPLFAPGWSGTVSEIVRVQDADGRWTPRLVEGLRTVDEGGDASAIIVLRKIIDSEAAG